MRDTVLDVKDVALDGNVIDNGWIENLKYDNGKTNMNAVLILSEIYYWYKPTLVRDEVTGEVLGYKKKFKADKLQKSYQALAVRFGLSKRQSKTACDFLVSKGLIEIEFRTIRANNTRLNNVMFIDINIKALKAITGINREIEINTVNSNIEFSLEDSKADHEILADNRDNKLTPLLHSKVVPSYIQTYHPPTFKCKTNTKTTTKTTTETTTKNIIPLQIKDLRVRYSREQLETIDQYLDIVRWTRKHGKIADSVILSMYKKWLEFRPEVVIYALETYVSNPKHHDKRENYVCGIMKNATSEQLAVDKKSKVNKNPYKTKFHNFKHTTTKYSDEELDEKLNRNLGKKLLNAGYQSLM